MKKEIIDKINGWGSILRFILPILMTIGIWILTDIKSDIKEVKQTAKELAVTTTTYNNNHLTHHSTFEKELCERVATIEALIRRIK